LSDVTIVQVDTLVMQNLGYFQLKASPGLWQLSIAPGEHLLSRFCSAHRCGHSYL
jgi:hypothetical protein